MKGIMKKILFTLFLLPTLLFASENSWSATGIAVSNVTTLTLPANVDGSIAVANDGSEDLYVALNTDDYYIKISSTLKSFTFDSNGRYYFKRLYLKTADTNTTGYTIGGY